MSANSAFTVPGSVAIVGVGGIFPGAPQLEQLWDIICNGRSMSREVPKDRWLLSPTQAFAPEPGAPDKVYSLHGCLIDAIPSTAELAGLALDPTLLAGLDPLFHLLLHAGKRAFDDGITEPLDRSRIGVIIGNLALPTEKSAALSRQYLGRTFEERLLGRTLDRSTTEPLNRYVAGLPAGILAQALGLGKGSCTLDAACASSLYAIKLAMNELVSGRADAMLTGGVSRPDCLYTQMGFSQLRALSRRGICSPFDAAGDGLVVGEGAGLFLLKRTEDAVAHGDRIYGIIRAVGLSNDIGGSLLAPLSEGQLRAMRAAYRSAGWAPEDVDLIECHATGTPIGDATEFASLRALWGDTAGKDRCVIGSVKSNIGHLLTAAGAAALTKVLLAMRGETLPPTANFSAAQPDINLDVSPFTILNEARPWPRRDEHTPRRAAVSAFGFGGINAHLLIEEWLPTTPRRSSPAPRCEQPAQPSAVAVVGIDASFGPWQGLPACQERMLGGHAAALPVTPVNWWGATDAAWFAAEGLDRTPFAGYYMGQVAVPTDRFRIPPREMEEMLPQQLLMLDTAAGAMADAGMGHEGNERTGVFVGIALDLNSTNFSMRWSLAERADSWSKALGLDLSPDELNAWTADLRNSACPPLTANRTMGALGNIVASRIAREFRIGGPSFTISSEESSGIRALETAVRLLQAGEIDRAVVGAIDLAGDLRAVLGHHAARSLSRSGEAHAFDGEADGSIIGEGATAVIVKRLEDAQRDGDRIYAVIKGIGSAGGAIVSPAPSTYRAALDRAYGEAHIDPATIDYVEAHGSGHPSDDRMEAAALATFFAPKAEPPAVSPRTCAVSSVAASIGHCGAASGLASLVRGCLALYQEIIPPCRTGEKPLPEFDSGRLYLPRTPRYWLRNRAGGPRRAGVSVFGVDGTCSHVVLEGWEQVPARSEPERIAPTGIGTDCIFALGGETVAEIRQKLGRLRNDCATTVSNLHSLSREWHTSRAGTAGAEPLAVVLLARSTAELQALLEQAEAVIAASDAGVEHLLPPSMRDRVFFNPRPIGTDGKIAFVFPGSGNHFAGMGVELSGRWPEIFRRQDADNLFLRDQFRPELFWNDTCTVDDDHRAVIFGQVAVGCATSDVVRSFGIRPQAVIGYSLGESAGLFALQAWRDRDTMLKRMEASTLFTSDLAGECRAAAAAWGLDDGKHVQWAIGVVDAPAGKVRRALLMTPRVYLLIVNTPDECVVGGDAKGVKRLVAMLDCRFFPLSGVTTVHCEVAREVAEAYRNLHLFDTVPPPDITFYSGAATTSYQVTRENAADAILGQAVATIDFPALIENAYRDGVRLFLEMGPGSSCSRMIGRILSGRPHFARSASAPGQDSSATMLRLIAQLVAERIPVNLDPLFEVPRGHVPSVRKQHPGNMITVVTGGKPFIPTGPPGRKVEPARIAVGSSPDDATAATMAETARTAHPSGAPLTDQQHNGTNSSTPVVREFASAQAALLTAHDAYLSFAERLSATLAQNLALQLSLQEAIAGGVSPCGSPVYPEAGQVHREQEQNVAAAAPEVQKTAVFNRDMCFEFARGRVSRMLGPAFEEADTFPTRVRLPDEPLMLVDRITLLEGEARSMTHGRVVTEHDVLHGAWYLDGGCIPTCIAVEAGQADLFLSGYLGIDFITRGLAVYRLLDAVVTFHDKLPGAGRTIRYDIRIDRFFRQGETHLFRFRFDATVDGVPLLTMRDGCAGFFSEEELAAGKGIVRPAVDPRPTTGKRPSDWEELVPMTPATYSFDQLERLRQGDLAGCFGPLFAGLRLDRPLTIPGGRMQLVHRVTGLEPSGGRYGLGLIRAEADIRPDDWFLTCHFVDDRVMPGTLMYECCMHTLRIFLLRLGWIAEGAEATWQPVPGIASKLCCRGQVLETTKTVTYEVSIRELGYGPEPFAVVDALMYADGKPIVEITDMSARLTGTDRDRLRTLWSGTGVHGETFLKKPAVYSKEQILAYSNGKPSDGFGAPYRIFDEGRIIARLPGPPYQFLDRITQVTGAPWQMVPGSAAEAQYDIPPDEWYFAADRQPRMPFAVLLEVALQPCGWLAAYVGSALTSPTDLAFRNLGGKAIQHRPVTPASGTVTATAKLTKVATSGGMIIQEFDFSVADRNGLLYEGETMFGFFSRDALANQVGIRDASPYRPSAEETARGWSTPFPESAPFPKTQLRMIDRIESFIPDGGPAGLGYLRGVKQVDPGEWFFAAHFYQDPVTPGSLGLEALLQLVKFAVVERWGWRPGEILAAVATGRKHSWLYRGQIAPTSGEVTVEAWITSVDERERLVTANGFLAVDGRLIYQMNDFTVRIEP